MGYCCGGITMFDNLGNLTITLICASIGFIVSIIYSTIKSRKASKEHGILIENAMKQWVENEKKRVQNDL